MLPSTSQALSEEISDVKYTLPLRSATGAEVRELMQSTERRAAGRQRSGAQQPLKLTCSIFVSLPFGEL